MFRFKRCCTAGARSKLCGIANPIANDRSTQIPNGFTVALLPSRKNQNSFPTVQRNRSCVKIPNAIPAVRPSDESQRAGIAPLSGPFSIDSRPIRECCQSLHRLLKSLGNGKLLPTLRFLRGAKGDFGFLFPSNLPERTILVSRQ